MKKFTQPTQFKEKWLSNEEVWRLGDQLIKLIETRYQGILKITTRKTVFAIYTKENAKQCISLANYVSLVNKTPTSRMVYTKLKEAYLCIISLNAELACEYATFVIKGPWPPGEAAIATSSRCSVFYATDIIKGPWPPGEDAIAADPVRAGRYAKDIIKGPWPPGEDAIASNAKPAFDYAYFIIKGPWPPGEDAIAASPACSYWYAKGVIKGPWPPGEDAITKDSDHSFAYARDVLKPAGADWSNR